MNPDISELLTVVDVKFLAGWVDKINADQQTIEVSTTDGSKQTLSYDRFILATEVPLLCHLYPALPNMALV